MKAYARLLAALAFVAGLPSALAADVSADAIMDKSVVDARGAITAQVKDFLVDTQDNRVIAAVLSAGDFLTGFKQVIYALPTGLGPFASAPVKLTMTKAQLAGLDLVPEDPRYRRTSDIMSAKIVDRAGKHAGVVKDVLIAAADGKVSGVVVEFDKGWFESGGLVALPLASLTAKEKDFVANFEAKDIRPATKPGAPPPPPPVVTTPDRDIRVTELIGSKLTDMGGKDLGEVRDLLVSTPDRKVTHLVLAVGARTVAYPLPVKDAKIAERKVALDAASVNAAPDLAPGDPRTRASVLLRAGVVDGQGNKVGDINDVVVNAGSGTLRYGVAEFHAAWIEKGKLVVVALRNVRPTANGGGLAVGMALEDLKGTMFFDKAGWPDLNDKDFRGYVDKYLGAP